MRHAAVPAPGLEDLWRHDSAGRPGFVADWAEMLDPESDGRTFWRVIRLEWPSFDRIDHARFADLFERFAGSWLATPAESGLPDSFTIYRGAANAELVDGLSWTLDRAVADRFARGGRCQKVDSPSVLSRTCWRGEVAMCLRDERNEAEIVLLEIPFHDFDQERAA